MAQLPVVQHSLGKRAARDASRQAVRQICGKRPETENDTGSGSQENRQRPQLRRLDCLEPVAYHQKTRQSVTQSRCWKAAADLQPALRPLPLAESPERARSRPDRNVQNCVAGEA